MSSLDLTSRVVQSIEVVPGYRNHIEFGDVSYPGIFRPGPIKVTMNAQGSHVRTLMEAWQKGTELMLKLQGVRVRAFVTELHPRASIDGLDTVDVVFRPTGKPIYGKSFTESIIEKIADAVKIDAQTLMADAKSRVPIYTGSLAQSIGRMERDFIHGHPNCRCVPVGITNTTRQEKLMKVRNRFYVAAPSVTTESEQAQDNIPGKGVRLSVSPNDRGGRWTRKNLADAIKHAEEVLDQDPNKDHVAIVRIVRVVRRKKAPVVVEVIK
jgi:hypothetical protein